MHTRTHTTTRNGQRNSSSHIHQRRRFWILLPRNSHFLVRRLRYDSCWWITRKPLPTKTEPTRNEGTCIHMTIRTARDKERETVVRGKGLLSHRHNSYTVMRKKTCVPLKHQNHSPIWETSDYAPSYNGFKCCVQIEDKSEEAMATTGDVLPLPRVFSWATWRLFVDLFDYFAACSTSFSVKGTHLRTTNHGWIFWLAGCFSGF